ncbi:hypothetical protein Cs7R123_47190 [Catellatospora sp. TT07R-123]|uniref:hypothetical protein n=1 Tax=Catellatospora sp. TT07R-123 TaxID=2733863 RepID=UPI001B205284|nr:hypothetical protein [Catellatospora sp. TT07R-123]GHJ47377.1 hypothetical protein Cs7R123_47190 [Catellatospora sp. TT07R-123]
MRRLALPLLLTTVLATAAACAGSSPDTAAQPASPSPVATSAAPSPSPSPSPDTASYEEVCAGRTQPMTEVLTTVVLYAGFAHGNYQGGDQAMKRVLGKLKAAVADYGTYLSTALKGSTDAKLTAALTADVARLDAWSKKIAASGTDYDGKVYTTISEGWTAFSDSSSFSALCAA